MCVSKFDVLQYIAESPFKVQFASIKRHFSETHQTKPKTLKRLIADLIQAGKLHYTSHYGCSFIEVSYDQPRAISKHVIIKPVSTSWTAPPDQLVVSLEKGASFGGGEHPTTRLVIQLIDEILHPIIFENKKKSLRAIDIGTGSGVLAIVAAKMGVDFVIGLDTDPCAVFEAVKNVRLNHVEDRVTILDQEFSDVAGSFDIVFANLRAPTLYEIQNVLDKKLSTEAMLFFSGLKSEETTSLYASYQRLGFFRFQERLENGWGAICMVRGPLNDERF